MALDVKGITLKEVTSRYPRQFQSLGYDVAFDVDAMSKPKIVSSFDLAINIVLTLLMMKPGQFPSIPELGIDIESYLFEYSDNKALPSEIKNKLSDQCNQLDVSGLAIEVYLDKTEEGHDALIVELTGTDRLAYGSEDSAHIIIGITYDKMNKLYVRKISA